MKKLAGAILFVCACVAPLVLRAQTAPAKAPSTSEAIKQLEHDWTDAEKAGDTDKLSAIIADDWVGIGTDGKETKKDLLADIKSGGSKIESFDFGPIEVKVLGSVAIAQGSDTEKSTTKGKDSSGKWVWMDVFVKRDGKWVAVRSENAQLK